MSLRAAWEDGLRIGTCTRPAEGLHGLAEHAEP